MRATVNLSVSSPSVYLLIVITEVLFLHYYIFHNNFMTFLTTYFRFAYPSIFLLQKHLMHPL